VFVLFLTRADKLIYDLLNRERSVTSFSFVYYLCVDNLPTIV